MTNGKYHLYTNWHTIIHFALTERIDAKNSYGMGGPTSYFYPGWFAEVDAELDKIQNGGDSEQNLSTIIDSVENKILWDGISYKETQSLTPAFWLKVDAEWENERYLASQKRS